MQKKFFVLGSIILMITWLFIMKDLLFRMSLPYNSEGRFYDAANSIVYHLQTTEVYCIFAVILTAILIFNFMYLLILEKQTVKNK